ncbi:MAG: Bax inhibitor-1/YccA family protein [Thermomicrobiales bacterium]|nr:Bax inhibitor-1/YccA family protein [Thermomicrobiales bacterium]
MSTQLLTDETFSAQNVAIATRGKQESGRMTLMGVTVKSLLFIAITMVFGAIGWNRALSVIETTSSLWFLLGYLALIAISIWAMANPQWASIVGAIYGAMMGLWMGAISRLYEAAWDGIVAQALLATVCVFVVCVLLYNLEVVRVTPRLVRATGLAMIGILAMYLIGWVLSFFNVDVVFWNEPNAIGIIVSVIISAVAALNLLINLDTINRGIKSGAPAVMEWYSAFSLLAALIWLYMEILRLLALTRSSSR